MDTIHFYLPDAAVTSLADDTALTVIAKSIKDLIEETNTTQFTEENLSQFTKHSFIAVNIVKTNYMIFSRIVKL